MIPIRNLLFLPVLIWLVQYSSAQTGTVGKALSLGESAQPTGITWDGTNLWMIDYSADMIIKINPSSGEVIESFEAPDQFPTGLAWDGNNLWCSGNRQNKIFKLDRNGEVIISLNVSSTPRGMCFVNGSIWYADSGKKELYKINPDSGSYLDTIPAPGGSARGLSFDGKYLWCSDANLNEIYKIDIDYKKIILILPATLDYPYGITWDGTAMWVAGYSSATINQVYTEGEEKILYIDSLKAHLEYSLTVRNVGSTDMNLRTWICEPYSSLKQTLDSGPTFSPYPLTMTTDQWNQRFAYYNGQLINPGDSTVYTMDMDISTYDIRYNILPDETGTIADVSASIQSSYLADGDYYEINNPELKAAVDLAIGSETNMYWKARKIHDYIIQKIQYVRDGKWDKAPQVLLQGEGSCSEYTFLFIAMCRAALVPARYEAGAYFGGSFPFIDQVFHRWTQIYLPPYGWIHVDATWDDREYPANQSRYFGASSKKVFATTLGGGGSNKISWTYNSANSQTGGIRERTKQFTWTLPGTSGFESKLSNDIVLHQNYPNPFSGQTTISFSMAKHSFTQIRILNLLGVVVKDLLSEPLGPGEHMLLWNSANLAPGTYLIQLLTAEEIRTIPCVITQ
ncbi:MAG: T9SS type A sorting domain-containing protein [Bacteroidetes bacterium]|jgi:DNA-binding beta-propeller fold protein YncE|nr:T9SS type A sorting domain-containing protein [Bacteroidota bacterium]MBT4401170.1 T9SS type A sorting domain-containing protein [Bacteroidota bacterium]MBT4411195.1 T9SS type A sorting domain-containing protein [Bacteroidota bacterium]MBT7092305.1 T9SS type A sorting domain-containing protein [Bacteroidota bacterium]MBT7463726.1 T9SS type A sorting domain-containing protein [Bacteroidota bacterium]